MANNQLIVGYEDTNNVLQHNESEDEKKETKRKPRKQRPFPQYSIEECLEIAKSIAKNNSGNPWTPDQVAASIELSPKTTKFIYLVYASRDYGLTTGTKNSETIELTSLGRKAVFPKDYNEEQEAIDKAFNNIDVFKQVNEYYKKSGLPEKRFLYNTLQENFQIPSDFHDEFYNVYIANINYLNENRGGFESVLSSEKTITLILIQTKMMKTETLSKHQIKSFLLSCHLKKKQILTFRVSLMKYLAA